MSKYLKALKKKQERQKFHEGSHSYSKKKGHTPHNPNEAGHAQAIAEAKAVAAEAAEKRALDAPIKKEQEQAQRDAAVEGTKVRLGTSEQQKPEAPELPDATAGVDEVTKRMENFKKNATDQEILDFFETGQDEIKKMSTGREQKINTIGSGSKKAKAIGQVDAADAAETSTVKAPEEPLEASVAGTELTKEIQDDVGPPQGSAAKVLEQVDTKNVLSSADTGKELAGKGVNQEISAAIANDPEGALEKLDGTDLESRANIADLPEEALMSAQMNGLLAGMEEGKTPLWAKPAVDKVNAMLAARGMTASSIGQGELFNAIIQSAMPIAQSNAQALQARASQKLDAAVKFKTQEAAFEQEMEIANLSNQQQAYMEKIKFKQQNMLSDTAAANATAQFNATSENQTKQFMASLENNINQYNSSAENAMKTFNITEKNKMEALNAGNELAVAQFNSQQQNDMVKFYEQNELAREQFNVTNAQAIEQSNLAWRRSTNTAATAAVNAANQQNVQNAFNMSTLEQTQMWQQLRDTASYVRDSYERDQDRKTTLFNTVIGNKDLIKSNNMADQRMSYWSNWLEKTL